VFLDALHCLVASPCSFARFGFIKFRPQRFGRDGAGHVGTVSIAVARHK
jgi:hypothetical protein